jgi:VWFA-related protein
VARPPWFLVLLLLLSSITGASQQRSGAATTVTLDVVVTDKSGGPVRGLTQQDFTLLDNKQPHSVTFFRAVDVAAGTPAPYIEVVLVVDAINANVLTADREREGIRKYLSQNGGKLPQPVSLVLVSDDPNQLRSKPSTDGNALAAQMDQYVTGLRTLNRSQGNFGAFDRFRLSLDGLSSLVKYESARPGRKLVIWMSPGWPLLLNGTTDVTSQNQERLFQSIVALSTQLRENHITLYNVETRGVADTSPAQYYDYQQYLSGVKSANDAYPAALSLQALAVQSGGRVLNRSNNLTDAIAAEIAQSAADASPFYVLSFAAGPSEKANEYHSLQVKVDKPGLTARTRTGYYAQP